MKILIDMNLSPAWVNVFAAQGWTAVHWSTVGAGTAPDKTIMEWAHNNGYIVFTHDLDFGTLLALTRVNGPSVIQVRTQNVLPQILGNMVVQVIQQYEQELTNGALITVDERRAKVRILPI